MSTPVPPRMIPSSRVLEEVGKLHVQLAEAEDHVKELSQQNAALAEQLKTALKKVTDLQEINAELSRHAEGNTKAAPIHLAAAHD